MALDGTSFSAALALANWSLYETKEEHDLRLPLLEAEHRRYMLSVPLQLNPFPRPDSDGVPKTSNGTSGFPKDLRNSTVAVCPKPRMGLVDFLKICIIQRSRCAQNLKWD